MEWLVVPIMLLAGFMNAAAGFGAALVSMPLLVALTGVEFAAPFFALTMIAANFNLIVRYRGVLNVRAVWRLCAGAFAGIPAGLLLVERVNESLIVGALGVLLVVYGVYALVGPTVPPIAAHPWSYGVGFVSGMLSGAYNTGGPPVIVYATSQQWPLAVFKGNLQAFFFINSITLNAGHLLAGNFTAPVVTHVVLAIPVVVAAQWLGGQVDDRIDQATFQRVTLVLLIVLGLALIAGTL